MWIVYVIQNSGTKELYFGFTSNLKRRLQEHNSGQNISTKRNNGTWILIYAEAYRNESDAFNREQRLKNHGSGKHELLKRLLNSKL
jgi:putative endonuclease